MAIAHIAPSCALTEATHAAEERLNISSIPSFVPITTLRRGEMRNQGVMRVLNTWVLPGTNAAQSP